jgi:hypothetical protein
MKRKLIAIGGAIARHFVGGLGIAAVAGKTPTIGDEDITKLIGAVMTLGAMCWSIWRKVGAGASPGGEANTEVKTLPQ